MLHPPVIAIIVPIHNRLNLTIQGLSCIMASIAFYLETASSPYNIQLIVVDDGSTDGSGDWIETNYPEIILLKGQGDLWWTGAINRGIEYFQQNFTNQFAVILQNDDIIIEKEWLANLLVSVSLQDNALIGCATVTISDQDRIYYGGISVHPWFSQTNYKNKGKMRRDLAKGHMEESFDLYGRGLFIPMEVFAKTGLFNAKRFKHRGDMDIPLRAKKLGYKLLVSYDAVVCQLPEHTFGTGKKMIISFKDACRLLTDFRSSTHISLNFYYSLQATRNKIQFVVFFFFRTLFSIKDVLERYFKPRIRSFVS